MASSSGGTRYIEVINNSNIWQSYLVKYQNRWNVDSTRRLICNVSDSVIADLIDVFNKPDTQPVVSHYELDYALLAKYADSVNTQFKPRQKTDYLKALQSTSIIKAALVNVTAPDEMDDRDYHSIVLVTKAGKTHEMIARPFGYLDYMVWQGGTTKYYNLSIQRIFQYFRLKDKETAGAKHRLYKSVAKQVYQDNFQTKFLWENFKTDHPAAFESLSKKFKPINLFGSGKWLKAQFAVQGIPDYITFETGFQIDSIPEIAMINRQLDTIVKICREAKFLMDHFKSQPGAKVVVYSESDGVHKPYFHFEMKSNQNNHSEWLAVDGKSLTLVSYSGYLKDPFSNKFEGIIAGKAYYNVGKQSNLIFDLDGKLVGGDKQVGHSDLVFK